MNIEPILQSEVRQKEKNKHHILTHIHGFHVSLDGKESTCNTGHLNSIPEWGRSLEEGNGYLLSAPVFLPGEWTKEPGGYSPWGCKELDRLND